MLGAPTSAITIIGYYVTYEGASANNPLPTTTEHLLVRESFTGSSRFHYFTHEHGKPLERVNSSNVMTVPLGNWSANINKLDPR